MKPASRVEDVALQLARRRGSLQDQGDLVSGVGELIQARDRLAARGRTQDVVVPLVAVAELALDVTDRVLVLVAHDKRGFRHSLHSKTRRAASHFGE